MVMLILIEQFNDRVVSIVESTYPTFMENYKSYDYLKSRATLTSTVGVVDQFNNHILQMILGILFIPIRPFIYFFYLTLSFHLHWLSIIPSIF